MGRRRLTTARARRARRAPSTASSARRVTPGLERALGGLGAVEGRRERPRRRGPGRGVHPRVGIVNYH